MQEAFSRGLILNDLVGWFGNTYVHHQPYLEAFHGYWIKAFAPVVLRIPDPSAPSASAARSRMAARGAARPAAAGAVHRPAARRASWLESALAWFSPVASLWQQAEPAMDGRRQAGRR